MAQALLPTPAHECPRQDKITGRAPSALPFRFVFGGCSVAQDAKDFLNQGGQALRNARYPEAVEAFQKAVAGDPGVATAHLYLATAYLQQYVPGAESAGNAAFARNATDEFLTVRTLESKQ
jgi:hypothetical protein